MPSDLRRFGRVEFREQVLVEDEGGMSVLGEAHNLSAGGVFVEGVDAPFGAPVVVHLGLLGASLRGTVRWRRPNGVGIQFGLVDARDTSMVSEIVARAARRSGVGEPR